MDALAALTTPRSEGCPSDLALSEYEAELLADPIKAQITQHLEGCDRCRAWLTEGRAAFDAAAAKDGPAIVQAMEVASRRSSWLARPWVGALATAAALLVAFLILQRDPPETTLKGTGLGLKIYRERGGKTAEVTSGAALFPKDRLRFEIDLPRESQVMIVGVEEGGRRYRCFPSASDASVALSAGAHQLLPDTIELDESLGRETVHLIACPRAFSAADLGHDGQVEAPTGCQMTSLRVHKSAP